MSRAPEGPLPADRFEEILAGRAPALGLDVPAHGLAELGVYLAELDRWRRATNLTGRLTPEELVDHALEALIASPLIADGETVADIGSGAGLPGVPLAILRPEVAVTLVEPRSRRAAFLRHVVRTLSLRNAAIVESRIEDVGGQTFDAATTRAVGGFESWIGEAGFLREGGRLLAWTTDPGEVSRGVGPRFRLEREVPIPCSRARAIAVFAKRG